MAWIQPAIASDETRHMHGHHMHGPMHGDKNNPCSMSGDMKDGMAGHHVEGNPAAMKDAFRVKKDIDGFSVSFHIMKAPEGVAMGGSHHVMIKVEKQGAALTDLVVNSKVTHPNEQSESKMMMQMGDWYMAAYDLGHPGPHEVMVLFKTADGGKHLGGVAYPVKE
ncbi:MAG: hypothetical protein Q9M30_06200 [Mariprofundaceae bacterium]|nr:hypothetical protein [Mariprofundaceae bacterium]